MVLYPSVYFPDFITSASRELMDWEAFSLFLRLAFFYASHSRRPASPRPPPLSQGRKTVKSR